MCPFGHANLSRKHDDFVNALLVSEVDQQQIVIEKTPVRIRLFGDGLTVLARFRMEVKSQYSDALLWAGSDQGRNQIIGIQHSIACQSPGAPAARAALNVILMAPVSDLVEGGGRVRDVGGETANQSVNPLGRPLVERNAIVAGRLADDPPYAAPRSFQCGAIDLQGLFQVLH